MQPTPYTPTTDFSQQEANNASGRSTVNTAALDAEFANVEQTLDETLANLGLIQRDDGKLADLTVQIHTISPEVLNLMGGFRLTGLWQAATAYSVNDIATNGDYTYVCHTAHTSGGAFDGQYWTQFGFSGGGDAQQAAIDAQNSANAAETSATSASGSATSASASATTATTQATNAANSATTATTQASNAGTSATNAANSAAAAATSAANLPNATTAGANKFLKTDSGGTAWEYQTAAQARASLGATTVGGNVFTAVDAAAARTALAARGEADDVTLAAGKVVIFEGATDDAFETTLTVVDPTADRTITLPNKSGTVAMTSDIVGGAQIQPISASVAANALTISASALSLDFRSTTLGSGAVTTVSGTPSNLVISSGSTLGTVSGQQSRIAVLAVNNAGTIELAAVNLSGGNQLDECNLISTTAEGGAGAADSASTIYSTTARTNVAYRVIGYIESTQATAGTWATAPSTIQGAGGNAVTAMSSLGYGQTWQNVVGSRAKGTTYYNTTGKPIQVNITHSGSAQAATLTVNGVVVSDGYTSASAIATLSAIVPAGGNYSTTSASAAVTAWIELR